MANKIQIKRSSVSGNIPSGAQLDVGELATNLADKRLFTKDGSGNVFDAVGQSVNTTANVQFQKITTTGEVVIGGNLTVNGSLTYVNTAILNVGDNIITLNADVDSATAPTENAGIEINRGSAANVSLLWDETNDRWSFGNTYVTGQLIANTGDNDITIGKVATFFPSTDSGVVFVNPANTNKAGIFTEVSGEILSYGTNVYQLNNPTNNPRNANVSGGIFRLDTRVTLTPNSSNYSDSSGFIVKRQPNTANFGNTTAEYTGFVVKLDTGDTYIIPPYSNGTANVTANVLIGTTSALAGMTVNATSYFTNQMTLANTLVATSNISMSNASNAYVKFESSNVTIASESSTFRVYANTGNLLQYSGGDLTITGSQGTTEGPGRVILWGADDGVRGGNTEINAGITNNAIAGTTVIKGGAATSATGGDVVIRGGAGSTGDGAVVVGNSSANAITVIANNNVGIGTDTPQRKLTIRDDTGGILTSTALYNANTAANNGMVVSFRTDTTGVGATQFTEMAGIRVNYYEHNHANRSAAFNVFAIDGEAQNQLTFTGSGRLGIKNTAPTHTLSVNGDAFIGSTANIIGNTSVGGNLIVTGNLTVSGTTTTIDSATLNVGDNLIVLNSDLDSGAAPTENAGITINRGSSSNANFYWNETFDRWTANSGSSNETKIYLETNTYWTSISANGSGVFHDLGGFFTLQAASGVNTIGNYGRDFFVANNTANNLTVAANGNVGIGNVTPVHKLTVAGQTRFDTDQVQIYSTTANTNAQLVLYTANTNSYEAVRFIHPGGNVAFDAGYNTSGSTWYINRFDANGAYVDTPMQIFRANGNIGISNGAPTHRLSVNGTAFFSSSVNVATTFAAGNTSITGFANVDGTVRAVGNGTNFALHASPNTSAVSSGLWIIPGASAGAYNNFTAAGDTVVISSNGTQNNGNLVIGTWSSYSTGHGIKLVGNTYHIQLSGNTFAVSNGSANSILIASNNNVGISNTAPAEKLVVGGNTKILNGSLVVGNNSNDGGYVQRIYSASGYNLFNTYYSNNDTSHTQLAFQKFRGLGNEIQSGDGIVRFLFLATNSTGAGSVGAEIRVNADATHNTTSSPSNITLWTTPSGSISATERVRVSANGNVGVGNTTPTDRLRVEGSFSAITKSFLINHPTKEGKTLRYASLEGPENGVYVRGSAIGSAIELPDYWTGLVDEDTITVSLTPKNKPQKLYVKHIKGNNVFVGSGWLDGTPNFYYTVYAERKDVPKLVIEE